MPGKRISSEKRTVAKMIRLYCRLNHGGKDLCAGCREVRDYAMLRLDKCRYGEGKPVCSKCETHCYRPDMKQRIKLIMQFSGPRMILYHPVELFLYLFRKLK